MNGLESVHVKLDSLGVRDVELSTVAVNFHVDQLCKS